jgi:hypothetical protein
MSTLKRCPGERQQEGAALTEFTGLCDSFWFYESALDLVRWVTPPVSSLKGINGE